MLDNIEVQKQGNEEWPECWLFYRRSEVVVQAGQKTAPDRIDCGELLTVKGNLMRYKCLCGLEFERVEGSSSEETTMWVAAHREHVTDPAQIETATCTICIPVADSGGIKTGCMQRDQKFINQGWLCNGRGHLIRRKQPAGG